MTGKMERGPSPLLPSLLVLGLGLLIYWSSLLVILEVLSSFFQSVLEANKSFTASILVLLVLLVFVLTHLPSSFLFGKLSYGINHQVSISSHDYDGFKFGFGTLLLVLLFVVLYNLIWYYTTGSNKLRTETCSVCALDPCHKNLSFIWLFFLIIFYYFLLLYDKENLVCRLELQCLFEYFIKH